MDLSIIVVNYNDGKVLPRCLASLERARKELALEVTVVDNGSTDGSIEEATAAHEDFRFIRTGTNLGFAGANNLGLRESNGRHVMLLNPDTEVLPGALSKLVLALDAHPTWGVVGPKMLDGRGRAYRAARRFPTPYRLFCECTRLVYLFPRTRLFGGYFYGEQHIDHLDTVDQIEGSALVIRDTVRREIGDLDEQFFLFFEEVDWCKRVRDTGFEIHVVSDAQIKHYRATTMTRIFLESRKANARSALRYFAKHHGDAGVRSLRRWMIAALWIRQVIGSLAAVFALSPLAKLRAEGARVERQVYREGLGSCA